MGTVYEQSVRDLNKVTKDDLVNFIDKFDLKPSSLSVSDTLKIIEILEYARRTNFMIDNGDRWDEQISGIANILEKIGDCVSHV